MNRLWSPACKITITPKLKPPEYGIVCKFTKTWISDNLNKKENENLIPLETSSLLISWVTLRMFALAIKHSKIWDGSQFYKTFGLAPIPFESKTWLTLLNAAGFPMKFPRELYRSCAWREYLCATGSPCPSQFDIM